MSDLAQAFEALGRPQSSAQAFIEAVEQQRPVIEPTIADNSVRLALRQDGQTLEQVNFASSARGVVRTLQVKTERGVYTHYSEAYRADTYHYVALGEMALQTDDCLLGVSFSRPQEVGGGVSIEEGAAHLFIAGKPNLDRMVMGVLYPHYGTDVSGITDDQKKGLLLRKVFGYVPTRLTAAIAAAHLAKVHEGSDEEVVGTFASFNKLLQHDSALQTAAELTDALPEFSERAVLTRYLLHQLDSDATLYGNDMALSAAQEAFDSGVAPISFEEMHGAIQVSVGEAVESYDRLNKFL